MIDVTEIKNVNELLEMKDDLNFFINKKIIAEMYAEDKKTPIELENDRKLARELLNNVMQRLKQLNPPARKKVVKSPPPVPVTSSVAV
jgi:hypothetical protein